MASTCGKARPAQKNTLLPSARDIGQFFSWSLFSSFFSSFLIFFNLDFFPFFSQAPSVAQIEEPQCRPPSWTDASGGALQIPLDRIGAGFRDDGTIVLACNWQSTSSWRKPLSKPVSLSKVLLHNPHHKFCAWYMVTRDFPTPTQECPWNYFLTNQINMPHFQISPDISRYLQTSSRTPCQSRPKLLRRCPRCPSSASSASSPSCWWQRSNLGLESYSSVGKDLESTSLNWDILSLEKYSFHLFPWDTKNKKRGKCSEMSWTKDRQARRTEDSTTLLYIVLPF